MKILTSICILLLLAASSVAYAQARFDSMGRPCIDASVQGDNTNKSHIQQDCDVNISRTVQAGQSNEAATQQHGQVNDSMTYQRGLDTPLRR
ncbi:hypothetical protein [Thiorhodospira sibirica]|uniref:hypothetical protein n=1 Tax=Thiorhodospira sibirica TaxID=154347 RepID=UPI00022C462A|nr:hypothetical protein [Thiorhodospira sibirica]